MTWPTAPSTAPLPVSGYDSPLDPPSEARAQLLAMRAQVEDLSAKLAAVIGQGEPVTRSDGTLAASPAFNAADDVVPDLGWIRKGFTFLPPARISITGNTSVNIHVDQSNCVVFSLQPTALLTVNFVNAVHGQRVRIGFYQSGGGGRVNWSSMSVSGAVARAQGVLSWLDAVYNETEAKWEGIITQASSRRDGAFNSNLVIVSGATDPGAGVYSIRALRYSYGLGLLHFSLSLAWTSHSGTGPMMIRWLPEIAASIPSDWILVPARVTVGVTRYDGASLVFKDAPDLPRLIDAAGNEINIGPQGQILLSGCIPFV